MNYFDLLYAKKLAAKADEIKYAFIHKDECGTNSKTIIRDTELKTILGIGDISEIEIIGVTGYFYAYKVDGTVFPSVTTKSTAKTSFGVMTQYYKSTNLSSETVKISESFGVKISASGTIIADVNSYYRNDTDTFFRNVVYPAMVADIYLTLIYKMAE